MAWHPLEPIDVSFFDTAPQRYVYRLDVAVAPEEVWRSLQSDESLAAWGPSVKQVRWTSARPFTVGTTREVELALGIATVRERFFVWEEGKRYAFEVYESNRKLFRRFGEDYVIEPHDGGSRLTWTVAIEPAAHLRRLAPVTGALNNLAFGRMARSGRSYFARQR
jgi:carbon monoxide dehydrogenase subunit G